MKLINLLFLIIFNNLNCFETNRIIDSTHNRIVLTICYRFYKVIHYCCFKDRYIEIENKSKNYEIVVNTRYAAGELKTIIVEHAKKNVNFEGSMPGLFQGDTILEYNDNFRWKHKDFPRQIFVEIYE